MLMMTSKPVQYLGQGWNKNAQGATPWLRQFSNGYKLAYTTKARYNSVSGQATVLRGVLNVLAMKKGREMTWKDG